MVLVDAVSVLTDEAMLSCSVNSCGIVVLCFAAYCCDGNR